MIKVSISLFLITVMIVYTGLSRPLPEISPEFMGMDPVQLTYADSLIEASINDGDIPGAVLVIVRDSVIVHRKAFGWMQTIPGRVEMNIETVFDLASLTKPVATATAVMKLLEQGRLRLSDPVSDYIPEYGRFFGARVAGREQPSVIDLLTHTAGMPFYLPVEQIQRLYGKHTADSLMTYMSEIPFRPHPDASFTYSCPSFIALQKIVEEVTGSDLATWTRDHIFEPLGMSNTTFLPDPAIHHRIAPTRYHEEEGELRGVVHDPVARELMKGISGNAGLFSTGDDLALFAAMLLNKGEIYGMRVLSSASVRFMTAVPEGKEDSGRTPGWDLSSVFSSNRGDLFGKNTYGHTGYTGTSMIIDPDTRTAVILLTNRVYPDDTGSITDLRARIANVVAASIIR